MRDTVRARGDEEIREETQKSKLKCLNLCNVYVQNMERKLIEDDPTFVVTSSQPSRETRRTLNKHQHELMRYFIDVEERTITTNSAAVLSTLMTRNIVKKISTEGPFPRGAVESETTRQDVVVEVNEDMKTQMSIDDMQLFVCEVIGEEP